MLGIINPEVVELTKQMINIPSVTGDELAIGEFLADYFAKLGMEVTKQEAAPQRYNIFAYSKEHPNPKVLFNSHIDTVPPHFEAREDSEWIYGRGACDTKGILAAILVTTKKLLHDGVKDFGILLVVGEEVNHLGILTANQLGLTPEHLIVGEPTENKLILREKGVVKVKLTSLGRCCHSGYPEHGASAIDPLIQTLKELIDYQWPGDEECGATTLNVGTIQGGVAANVLADRASAEVMVRVSHHADKVLQVIESTCKRYQIECETILKSDPFVMDNLKGFPTGVVSYATDTPHFQHEGKVYLWGPGSIMHAHTKDERIGKAEISQAVDIYTEIVNKLL
jgi:acetylornithine deacetylase